MESRLGWTQIQLVALGVGITLLQFKEGADGWKYSR
jgi:hypothetical protein